MKKLSLRSLKKMFAYGERIQPTRDWFILLGIVLILLIVGVGWNIFLFTQFENGTTVSKTNSAPAQKGVGAAITQVQTIFQQRATEETNYQQNYHFVDPSTRGS